jgi:uncharacterized protein (DUF2141 family)
MLNQKGLNLLKKVSLFSISLAFFACANRQLPQGGPRDRTPPKLLKAEPANNTRNFSAKRIQLDFDEFFKLNNQSQEITMTPNPAKQPEYKIRQKSLVIDLKDTLEKNTTYVINFGKAIADVNEGNILKNFTYVFSTGLHIDSLSISGTVINNETQERQKDATVMLFNLKQDTAFFGKKKPTVYTTTDSSGNFSINNLHADKYRIYALFEKSPDKIYNRDEELIGFLKKEINLTSDTSNIHLNIFRQEPEQFRLAGKSFDQDGKMSFVFNKKLDKPSIKIVYPKDYDKFKIVDFSKANDSAMLYMKNMDFDSIRVAFFDNNKPLDSTSFHKGKRETFNRQLGFIFNLNGDFNLKPGNPLAIKANFPIDSYDTGLISLKEDSTDITNFSIERDTSNLKKFNLKYKLKQNSNYLLTFEEGAFTDIFGDKNKRTIRKFALDKEQNYSQLTLTVNVPDTGKSYIVQLMNDDKVVLRSTQIHESTAIVYKNFITAKYRIKVIYDGNGNGKWDSGNVKKRIQPENIWVSKEILTLRANWEQQSTITIPKEPATY